MVLGRSSLRHSPSLVHAHCVPGIWWDLPSVSVFTELILEKQRERYLLCWDSIITSYFHTLGTCPASCFFLLEHLGIKWTLHLRSCSSLLCKLWGLTIRYLPDPVMVMFGYPEDIGYWRLYALWDVTGDEWKRFLCLNTINFPKIFILTQCSFKLSLERGTDPTFLPYWSIHLFTIYFICLNVCLHITHMHIRPLRQCGKQLWATL